MEIVQMIFTIFSTIVSFGTACTLVYAFAKFLGKPHDTLEQRLTLVESQIRELDRGRVKIEGRCIEQDDTNEILTRSVLALIEFEIQYCLTEKKPMSEDLKQAKEDLHKYLSKK